MYRRLCSQVFITIAPNHIQPTTIDANADHLVGLIRTNADRYADHLILITPCREQSRSAWELMLMVWLGLVGLKEDLISFPMSQMRSPCREPRTNQVEAENIRTPSWIGMIDCAYHSKLS